MTFNHDARDRPDEETEGIWHVPEKHLTAYVFEGLDDPAAWSVETHVAECAACATRVGEVLNCDAELAAQVGNVREKVITQARNEAHARARVGSGAASSWSRTWRLLTAAPALRVPWMAAVAFAAACAVALSLLSGREEDDSVSILLLVAPLLPLAGVAVSYGPGMDPAYELHLSTPYSGLRLLLLRTMTVLGVTVPLLLPAAFLLPSGNVPAAVWLLPTLALVLVTLALGSWIEHHVAAAFSGGAWVAAVLVPPSLRVTNAAYVFEPTSQLVWTAAGVFAAGLLITRRDAYDRMGGLG